MLPAQKIADELNRQLDSHNSAVVTAPPGAGKSTLLPITIYRHFTEGRILVLEPRRLAARQIAERMAFMLSEKVGETVGYRVRQDTKVSDKTRIEVITEGILTRMLISDPELEGVSVVIFDEFHERSLNSDVALTLCRESQSILRPDLRIVVMSATIDTSVICEALSAPLVESEGRMFPVDIIYSADDLGVPPWNDPKDAYTTIIRTILKAHREHEGDILVFLPGEAEIRRCEDLLSDGKGLLSSNDSSSTITTHICPLYGLLSPDQQRLAIAPSKEGERKIVLATSIAETSITIEGVRVVIDTGLCRKQSFDQRTGLSHLETVRISMDMANQRSGRAGRVAPGVCYRLWTKSTEYAMEECRTPEILYADLAPLALDVAAWGENDIEALPWLTLPPRGNVKQGHALLSLLKAIDEKGNITPHGKTLWRHPYHPRIANMIAKAETLGMKSEAIHLAETLENQRSPKNTSRTPHSNIILQNPSPKGGGWEGALLSFAYPERIAHHLPEGIGRYRLANGSNATVDANDPLCSHEWIVIASMNASGNGNVFLAAPLSPSDLEEHITERENLSWDNKQGCIIAQRERRIGNLLVDARPLANASRELIVSTICEAAKKYGTSMLDFSDSVLNMQRRIATASLWHPELELPDFSTEAILERASEWLPLFIGKASTTAELKKIDLASALWNTIPYDVQQSLDRIVPTHITLPSGRRHKVEYRQGAEAPIVRVRLQECFGMTDTPRVDNGSRPILMELLSPGFKPVQLTQDLRSFWSSTYFEVRKELRRRYPKHAWPEDPTTIINTEQQNGKK